MSGNSFYENFYKKLYYTLFSCKDLMFQYTPFSLKGCRQHYTAPNWSILTKWVKSPFSMLFLVHKICLRLLRNVLNYNISTLLYTKRITYNAQQIVMEVGQTSREAKPWNRLSRTRWCLLPFLSNIFFKLLRAVGTVGDRGGNHFPPTMTLN